MINTVSFPHRGTSTFGVVDLDRGLTYTTNQPTKKDVASCRASAVAADDSGMVIIDVGGGKGARGRNSGTKIKSAIGMLIGVPLHGNALPSWPCGSL